MAYIYLLEIGLMLRKWTSYVGKCSFKNQLVRFQEFLEYGSYLHALWYLFWQP